jgi:DNA-binding CsgD family transcriptional regulator
MKTGRLYLGENFNHQYLTEREQEILKYIVLGYTAKRAGCVLNISFRTVEAHIEKLRTKLNCASKAHIIEKIITEGLIHKIISTHI